MIKPSGVVAALFGARPGFERLSGTFLEIALSGPNPGGLKMFRYRPAKLIKPAPLVVVLHGCTQTAAGYAQGAGWIALAERYGFALLCPQQRTANNLNRCFNWFQPADATRGRGEAASIRGMIAQALADSALDPARVFITGLSAGGAMTSSMLAAYPEVFAGGAIIAGLPHGAAANLREGFTAMMQPLVRACSDWGDQVRSASPNRGAWPKISIWQGEADTTVNPRNAEEIAKQWLDVHGLAAGKPRVAIKGADQHYVWSNARGEPTVEVHRIQGLGHGAPIISQGVDGCGQAGPFLIEAGVSSSLEIARFWGLTRSVATPIAPEASMKDRNVAAPLPSKRHGIALSIIKVLTGLGLVK